MAHPDDPDLDLLTLSAGWVKKGHPFRMKHRPPVGTRASTGDHGPVRSTGPWSPGRRPERLGALVHLHRVMTAPRPVDRVHDKGWRRG